MAKKKEKTEETKEEIKEAPEKKSKKEKKEDKKKEKEKEQPSVAEKAPALSITGKLELLGLEGVVANYRRGRHEQNQKQAILMFPVIKTKKDANKLIGRTVLWTTSSGKDIKGVIRHAHGNSGSVRAIFKKTGLPGQAIGQKIKIIK